jgi:hypothetical protein
MTDMVGVVGGDRVTIETPVTVKFIRTFTVLGRIKMIVKMRGDPNLQIHEQNLSPEESNNTELILGRMEGSDAYMVAKQVKGIDGYIFCDVLRRSKNEEISQKLLEFVSEYVKGGKASVGPIYVPIHGHERVNCAVRGAEKVWIVVEGVVDPLIES